MLATEKNQRTTARPCTTPLKPCLKIGIFFIDFLGPGISFPLGNYPFYHPISIIFGSNLNLFFLFSGVVNFYIQIYYFNKILKF